MARGGHPCIPSILTAAGTAGLLVATWALAADETTPPKGDLPKSPEEYNIQIVSSKPPVVQQPSVDSTQQQPNLQDFYTSDLKRAGLQGTAVVEVFVLADGTAGVMRINQSTGAAQLDDAAKAAVEQMRFVPGTIDGQPNPMWARFAISFKLDPEEPEAPEAAATPQG